MVQRGTRHRQHALAPKRDPNAERSDAHGFTMIELLMVVVVLSILLLIAIPTFLGARKPAEDRQAQTILRTSLVAATTGSADTGDYAWVTPGSLQVEESSVVYLAGATHASATQNEVSVATGMLLGDTYVILSSMSAAGRCFAVFTLTSGPTEYQMAAMPSCNAGAFVPGVGWGSSW
jgi:type IV pilus assembly protein PilA